MHGKFFWLNIDRGLASARDIFWAVSGLPHTLTVLPREKSSRYQLNRTRGRTHVLPTFHVSSHRTDCAVSLSDYCELFSYLIVQRDETGKVRSLRDWHRNCIGNVSQKASKEETAQVASTNIGGWCLKWILVRPAFISYRIPGFWSSGDRASWLILIIKHKIFRTYTIAVCTMKTWWWTEELSETCRVLFE